MKKILFFIFLSCSLFANLAGQAPTKIALRCPAPNPSSYSSISTIFIGDIIHTPCPNRSSIFTGKVNFSGATITGLFPVTTKGDLFTFSNVAARLGVGVNGQILSADNTTATGLKWVTGTGGTVTSVTSANGNATVANTTTTPVITIVQAPALKSATTTVDVSAATAPSANQVLTATNSTTATWQTPAAPGVGTVTSVTSANGNATVANTTTTPVITIVQAPALKSATTTVDVSAATAPSANQVLTATNSTTATWQTPAAPGVGTVTSVTSANGNATVANTTTTPVITIVKAPAWTTARNLAGNSVDGSGNVAFANKFIVQGTTDTGLSGPQFLGALGTGIVKNTTTTGVLSIAANSDLPVMSATVGGAVPTPPNNTTTFLRGDGTFNTPASSGVTNSAGANVITKSNGTNLVASRITDDGTTIGLDASTGVIRIGNIGAGTNLLTISNTTGNFDIDNSLGLLRLGDVSGAGNNTSLIVDDGNTGIVLNAVQVLTGNLNSITAGSATVGTATLPYSSLYLGSTAAHNSQITGTFTGNRVVTIPDVTFTIAQAGTQGRVTGRTNVAAVTFLIYTVGAADQSFTVSGNVLVTASATHTFTMTVSYTDESNAARVLTLNFSQLTGTFLTAITNVQGVGAYEGIPLHIRCKAGTVIGFSTVGTFTSVTYNAEGSVQPI